MNSADFGDKILRLKKLYHRIFCRENIRDRYENEFDLILNSSRCRQQLAENSIEFDSF